MRTLKQNRRSFRRYYRKEIMPRTYEAVGRAINRLRYKSRIWGNSGEVTRTEIYQMVNAVRCLSGFEPMSRELFEDGYQYCTIFADNYKYAFSEFRALCCGDW